MSTIAVLFAIGGASAYAASHLPNNSVTSKTIKNGQVKTKDLQNNAVKTAKLANGAVTGSKIADQAVGTGQIANNAVTTGQLANNAVTSGQLANNAVTTGKIAANAVTTGQLANNAVTNGKLADNAVSTGKIADSAVTNSKLAANSVSGLVQVVDGTITGSDILENTLTFGCIPSPNVIAATGATGPFQVGGTGSCGFVVTSGSHTWAQADAACSGIVPDSTLPSAAQLEQVAQAAGDQSVPTGSTGIWLDDPSGIGSVWTASVDNTAHVSAFATTLITASSSGPVVCVYQPASKQG
ncbi:MAG TPA: hypothetical protein VJL81_04325 [Solirubrobacterales bacterium]|nr:hypothetical protein [Solirubrobacterales bacterium]